MEPNEEAILVSCNMLMTEKKESKSVQRQKLCAQECLLATLKLSGKFHQLKVF
jgi:hypothetical protein